MAVRDGSLVKITIGGTEIGNLTTTSLNLSMSNRSTTTKDDARAETSLPTRYTGTASGSVLFDEAETYGFEEMYDAFIAGTIGTAVYTTGTSGDVEYSASAYYTEISLEDPDADNSAVNFTLQLTGALSKATIA